MDIILYDSELKVMEVLWREGEIPAGIVAKILLEQTGWNRNTTYTVIKKLIEKGAVERFEPGFVCKAVITKKQVQAEEASRLIGRMFDGSAEVFLSAFFGGKNLSDEEIQRLKNIVENLK